MYFSPNSPGANVTAEQNPSDEVINRVEPSFDLYTSVWSRKISGLLGLPCDVCEGSKVQVTNDAQRLLLLGVVDMDGVLCCYSIDHTIRQAESRSRTCWRSGVAICISFRRLR